MRHFTQAILTLLFLVSCSEQTVGKRNQAPTAEITSHITGSNLTEGIVVFKGQVSDLNHLESTLRVNWILDDTVQCESRIPDESGRSNCAIDVNETNTRLKLEVKDPDNAYGEDAIEINVSPSRPPSITLNHPNEVTRYTVDELIEFEALLSDEDGSIADLSSQWTSHIDGALSHLDTSPDSDGLIYDLGYLSEGLHTIRLLVTDSDGLEASETVAITVDPENQSPSCSIINPLDPTEADNTELIIF